VLEVALPDPGAVEAEVLAEFEQAERVLEALPRVVVREVARGQERQRPDRPAGLRSGAGVGHLLPSGDDITYQDDRITRTGRNGEGHSSWVCLRWS
jgi:hypothetical protein